MIIIFLCSQENVVETVHSGFETNKNGMVLTEEVNDLAGLAPAKYKPFDDGGTVNPFEMSYEDLIDFQKEEKSLAVFVLILIVICVISALIVYTVIITLSKAPSKYIWVFVVVIIIIIIISSLIFLFFI